MGKLHPIHLSDEEIIEETRTLFDSKLAKYGYEHTTVAEESDFDGAPILRMIARVNDKVPARELIDLVNELHSLLRSKGDERYVYLSTNTPTEAVEDEDED